YQEGFALFSRTLIVPSSFIDISKKRRVRVLLPCENGVGTMAPPNSLRMLVIDDDPGVVNVLTRLLRRDGYLVHTARNGHDALARLHEYHYDLILCDLLTPGRDGRAFYALLLRQYPFLHWRVIFHTGDISGRR